MAAEDFDLIGETAAAAEDVVCQSGEGVGEAGGLGAELGNVRLGLGGEFAEREGLGWFDGVGGGGSRGDVEGREGLVEVVCW